MIDRVPFLTPLNWIGLIHPVLMILFVYPVVGATIRLGILARERRLDLNPIAPTVPVEHADHGRWVTGGMVLSVLVAFSHNAIAGAIQGDQMMGFLLAVVGAAAAYVTLLGSKGLIQKLLWASACWFTLMLIASQPALLQWREAFPTAVWKSHFWGGSMLIVLMLGAVVMQKEIAGRLWMRRLHISMNIVVALLLATQAITGTRDLLMR
ncbi:MAG: hypothetical protein CMK50_04210 [Propionibacteriaceae bacterium]|nr:hypothetical protein [Propionibacteriaceae bacterium]